MRKSLILGLSLALAGPCYWAAVTAEFENTLDAKEVHQLDNDAPGFIQEEAQTLSERISDMLDKATHSDQSFFYLFFLAFLAGILTSFTPCVYPMIPVTIGILQIQKSTTLLHNFIAALTYVMGISVVYATLGYMSASISMMFGQWVANPFVVLFIVIFFLYLAFSMFGFYEIYMPRFLTRNNSSNGKKGSLLKIFFLGMISGTVASPCLTPALAVLLALVAKVGNPIIGFAALFLFSLGMGLLLIIIGTFSGAVSMLPRSGQWMNEVQKAMGFMLIAVAVYFGQPLMSLFIPFELTEQITFMLYGVLALSSALYFLLTAKKNMAKLLFGLLCGLGGIWLIGTAIKGLLLS